MKQFADILAEGLNKMRDDVIRASRDAGQEASGKTYRNITVEVTSEQSSAQGAIYAPVYFYTLIRGRGPGKIPANLPQLIMEWARYKGITFADPRDMVRFGNAVAYKIKKEGSQLYRNHLYVDIIDTPAKAFEEWLGQQIDGVMDVLIEQNFVPAEDGTHGYII